MTHDTWLATHPYLQPVAEVDALVAITAAESCLPLDSIPDWDGYADDFHAGVPLLKSAKVAIDFSPPEAAVRVLVTKLASSPLPDTLALPPNRLSVLRRPGRTSPQRAGS